MGGVCWISPRNCGSASSTFSRVTCLQGAVRTRAPSLSYVSVSHPSKHVVRYSFVQSKKSFSFLVPLPIPTTRTPSARGSSVPPCPTLTLSLRTFLLLPAVFSSFSFSTKRRELQTSFFNWSTTCIDVGPDGFITPKRPDRGSEGGAFGILERYESGHKGCLFCVSVGCGRECHHLRACVIRVGEAFLRAPSWQALIKVST